MCSFPSRSNVIVRFKWFSLANCMKASCEVMWRCGDIGFSMSGPVLTYKLHKNLPYSAKIVSYCTFQTHSRPISVHELQCRHHVCFVPLKTARQAACWIVRHCRNNNTHHIVHEHQVNLVKTYQKGPLNGSNSTANSPNFASGSRRRLLFSVNIWNKFAVISRPASQKK